MPCTVIGLFDIYGVRSRKAEEFFELLRKDNEVKLEEEIKIVCN